jgi:3',5'-cyclic AMP phosphodiesterase CpdA
LADELAEQYNAPILHTGDLIDFVSLANLERSRAFVDSHDLFMAAGNHEFSLYVGEAWEDAAYRNQSLAQVQESFDNDIRMSSRVIGGVNFIALDNGYYLFEEDQLAFLQSEAEKGLPMVLMMHNPLYEKEFYEQITYHREQIGLRPSSNLPCAYLTGVPAELMGHYDDHRRRQQTPDEVTLRTIEWIRSCPLIRAVLAGHVHYSHVAKLTEDVPQIITSVTDVRVITVT